MNKNNIRFVFASATVTYVTVCRVRVCERRDGTFTNLRKSSVVKSPVAVAVVALLGPIPSQLVAMPYFDRKRVVP